MFSFSQEYKEKHLSPRNSQLILRIVLTPCNFWGIFSIIQYIQRGKSITFYLRYLGDLHHYITRKLFIQQNTKHLLACCVSTYFLRQKICHQSSSFLERFIEVSRWQNANFLGCCFTQRAETFSLCSWHASCWQSCFTDNQSMRGYLT